MPHDKNVGSRQKITYSADGLHENSAFFSIPKGRGFLFSQFCFLAFPDFISEIVDNRILQLVITL